MTVRELASVSLERHVGHWRVGPIWAGDVGSHTLRGNVFNLRCVADRLRLDLRSRPTKTLSIWQPQAISGAETFVEDQVAVVGHGEPRKAGEWPEASDLVVVEIPCPHAPAGK